MGGAGSSGGVLTSGGLLAQGVECRPENWKIVGSNPTNRASKLVQLQLLHLPVLRRHCNSVGLSGLFWRLCQEVKFPVLTLFTYFFMYCEHSRVQVPPSGILFH